MRQTRRVSAEALEEAAMAKRAAAAASSSTRCAATSSSSTRRAAASPAVERVRTPSPSRAGSVPAAKYDLGSFNPRKKRRAEEEEDEYVLYFPHLFSDSLLESLHLDLDLLLQRHGDAGPEGERGQGLDE